MIWPVARLVWESRGQKMETVSLALTEACGEGFSVSSLQRLTAKTRDEVPEHVVAVIQALAIMPGAEDTAEVVRRGLAALEKGPAVDAEALVAQLASKLPRLDPEVIALAVAAKLPDSEAMVAQLKVLQSTVDHSDAKGELIELKRDRDRRALIRAVWGSCAVGVVTSFVLAHWQHAPATAPAPVVLNISWGAMEEAARAQQGSAPGVFTPFMLLRVLPSGELGEKLPPEQYVPSKLLPYQKPPPCLTEAREEEINGGCWQQVVGKPPCGRMLFRNGDTCYRPIAADPQKPVVTPRLPGQEPH